MIVTTKAKVALASRLSRLVLKTRRFLNRPPQGTFLRGNLRWSLDLREGIDFSVYLFGAFEPSLVAFYKKRIEPGQTILDIGANIGVHTLYFAQAVGPNGRVIAVEATDYACRKLQANLDLNQELRPQVRLHHALLAESVTVERPQALHSSWPLDGGHELHATHQGKLMAVGAARVLTLDQLVHEERLIRAEWIKLDVDGNELSVLRGATTVLRGMRPRIFMELAPSCYEDHPDHFDELIELMLMQGYNFYSIPSLRLLPATAAGLRKLIPNGASINVILEPNKARWQEKQKPLIRHK